MTDSQEFFRSAGEAIVDGLIAHGVDTVFGIPGVQTYPLFDALAQADDRIRTIGARHEQACAYMAFGYAQSTGRTGVFSVVPGPGVLNAGAAMLTALGASTPLVGLTSEVPSIYMGRGLGHLHEMPDQLETLRSFTKWAANVGTPSQVPEVLAEAFYQANSGRPGPAVVATPWDVLAQRGPVEAPHVRRTGTPPLDHAGFERAATLLADAQNPLIMVGGGARHASTEIIALAERLQAPVVSFRSGRGIVPQDHPLGFTSAEGFERWAETDVLLAIGTRQELAWFRWPDRPDDLVSINLDIDPLQHVRLTPTLGLVADAREGAARLGELLAGESHPSRAEEFAQLRSEVARRVQELQPHLDYLGAIREALPRDGFFVEEISQIGFASYFGFPVYEPRHFVTSGHQGTLGFGFPTALGVKAGNPDKPVVSVTGDGGFLFGVQELATAVQYGLGVITIVFNNNAYGNVKVDQLRLYDRPFGSDLVNPDFVALAESFGARGHRAHSPTELRDTLRRAIDADEPAVIEVPMPLDPDATPWRFLMPATRRDASES
ncbi:thiamine pyrophosphate-dependent enzyme [Agromyces sp. M3QZ16-3]|uniref:thiamine pyrophosphate-dependent enzyme n=1 Tax=Agromyces sp. M3QZ16-3 TaxID=3447585 RepID=UPI003F68E6A9